jgi:maltose O-acetyltransferase
MIRQAANVIIFSIASVRTVFWRLFLHHIGSGSFIREGVLITHPSSVDIGKDVYIGRYCELDGFGGLAIGNDVHIAPFCAIYSSNHKFDGSTLIRKQGYVGEKVVIEDDVWIGTHVVILSGVTVHTGAVIGAGSVVTKDVPPNAVVAGVPAKVLKYRSAKS